MTESNKHLELVKKLRDTIKALDGVDPRLVVAEDHEENTTTINTSEGYRPDVFYDDGRVLIIGEAKTSSDIYAAHSEEQIKSYLKYCSAMLSERKVYLYIAVPWEDKRGAKHHYKRICQNKIPLLFIDELGIIEEV